jgi:hypothetical protein
MVCLCGDTHGNLDIDKLINYFKLMSWIQTFTKDDYLIILGDAGVCWDDGIKDQLVWQKLKNLPVTTLWIDGNHENFGLISKYPVKEWHGGKVLEIEPDILHLMRGQIFNIDGMSFFTFGGAHSTDKAWRTEKISWWPEELPSKEEYEQGIESLKANDYKVDYILSHTAPREVVQAMEMEFLEGEEELQRYLQKVSECTEFKDWYFGHFHEDLDIEEYHCLMERIIKLS